MMHGVDGWDETGVDGGLAGNAPILLPVPISAVVRRA